MSNHHVYLIDNTRQYFTKKIDVEQTLKGHERVVYLGVGDQNGIVQEAKTKQGVTGFCCYCERKLTTHNHKLWSHGTKEHIVQKSKGGKKTFPCCHRCNSYRKRMLLKDFLTFMVALDYLGVQERLTIVGNIERFMLMFPDA